MDRKELEKALKLLSAGNAEYASFNKRIVNTNKDVIGVRLPDIRRLAKDISKGMDADAAHAFLACVDKNSYEQVMTAGHVINYSKISEAEKIALTREYLKYVDSWALIDSFTEKMKKFDEGLWWGFAMECLASDEEYTVRCGVIRLMESFLSDEYLADVFAALRDVKHEGYYVKMGMAWLYAEAALLDFMVTIAEVDSPGIDPWTRNKAYQKMLESNRLTQEQKELIRKIRKKGKK